MKRLIKVLSTFLAQKVDEFYLWLSLKTLPLGCDYNTLMEEIQRCKNSFQRLLDLTRLRPFATEEDRKQDYLRLKKLGDELYSRHTTKEQSLLIK